MYCIIWHHVAYINISHYPTHSLIITLSIYIHTIFTITYIQYVSVSPIYILIYFTIAGRNQYVHRFNTIWFMHMSIYL